MLGTVAAMTFASQTWYGPVTVSFKVQFAGNPYDPEVNDVRVRFQAGKEKPAYPSFIQEPAPECWSFSPPAVGRSARIPRASKGPASAPRS